MLTWNDKLQKDQSGKVLSVSYRVNIPHWGEASIHPHIHHPGEMFLTCPGLDIKMHPLGRVLTEDIMDSAKDAISPAEAALVKALEQRGVWCLEALAAICVAED